MTLSKRLTRLERTPARTPARDLCHCPIDYRRGITEDGGGPLDNGVCPDCGKPTNAIAAKYWPKVYIGISPDDWDKAEP